MSAQQVARRGSGLAEMRGVRIEADDTIAATGWPVLTDLDLRLGRHPHSGCIGSGSHHECRVWRGPRCAEPGCLMPAGTVYDARWCPQHHMTRCMHPERYSECVAEGWPAWPPHPRGVTY